MELHEHVLGQILGRGAIGEHPAGDPEHEPLVMAHQVGEGVQVAAPGAGEPAIPGVGAGIGPREPDRIGPGGSVIHGVVARWCGRGPGSGQRQSRHLPAYYAKSAPQRVHGPRRMPGRPVGRP